MILLCLLLAADPEPLRVWHAYREAEASVLARAVSEHDPSIIVTQIPYDSFQSKLMQALSAGVGPDLFVAPHERLEAWWRFLDPVTVDGSDMPVAQDAMRTHGALYGHPYALKTLALIRNKALAPIDVTSLDALEAPPGGFAVGYDTTSFYFHAAFFFAVAPTLFDGDALHIGSREALQSFAWLRAATSPKTRFVSRGLDHTQLVSQFKASKIAALVDGPWLLSDLGKDVAMTRVQTLPPVRIDGVMRTPKPFATIDGLFVSKGPHAEAAHALALALQSEKHCRARSEEARQLPALLRCRDLLSAEDAQTLGPFFDQMQSAVPMPATRAMGSSWIPLKDMLSFTVNTDRPLEDAAKDVTRAFDRLMLPDTPAPLWLDVLALGALFVFIVRRFARRKLAHIERPAQARTIAVLLGPTALFVSAFLLLPFFVGAGLAFFSHEAGVFTWVGVGNFIGLLSQGAFYSTLLVTIAWTALNIGVHLVIGVSLALLLDHPRVRLKRWFRAILILPWAIPNYISALVFHNLFNFELGAINTLLQSLGLTRVDWFASFVPSFTANLIANSWLAFPFVMVVTLGALQSIDKNLVEAMRLDGATSWQRFRYLTLPSIAPSIAPAMVLSALWTFNMFNIIALVSGGEPRGQTDILITEAYHWAFTRGARYGYAAAYCAAIFVVLQGFIWLKDRVSRA